MDYQLHDDEKALIPFFIQLRCASILIGIEETPAAIEIAQYLENNKQLLR